MKLSDNYFLIKFISQFVEFNTGLPSLTSPNLPLSSSLEHTISCGTTDIITATAFGGPITNDTTLWSSNLLDFSNPSGFVNTLFKQYYDTYITQVFTKSNRIIKVKAFLPLRILLNYTLADKFIYKGRKHQINSITTNLNTGESEIELLNIVIE